MIRAATSIIAAAMLAVAPTAAAAQDVIISTIVKGSGSSPPPSYTGPGDVKTTGWVAWAGVRAFTAAIAAAGTQPLFNLTRASDSHTCDFLVATNGGVGNSANCPTGGENGQSLSAWLSGTSVSAATLYDQTGGGTNYVGPSAGFLVSCSGTSKPCIDLNGSNSLAALSSPAVSQGYSVSAVAMRTSAGTYANIWHGGISADNVAQLGFRNTANQVLLGNDEVTASAADNAQHAFTGVMDGPSSVLNVDGTETPGTVSAGGTSSGGWCIGDFNCSGASNLTGNISEVGVNSNVLTGPERTALCANQRGYYAISGTC